MEVSNKILSHKDLVKIAYRWVLRRGSCGVSFKEFNSAASNGEYPDVLGFGAHGHSVLIEVKCSRSDFLVDKKKSFRQYPELGMGTYRFYCCPKGLIKSEELPTNWGLIYVNENKKPICVHNPYKADHVIHHEYKEHVSIGHNGFSKNIKAEHGLMYSALRRLHIRGRIDEIYNAKPKITSDGMS